MSCPAISKGQPCGRRITRPEGTCGLHAPREVEARSSRASAQWASARARRAARIEVWFLADDPKEQRRVRNPIEVRRADGSIE